MSSRLGADFRVVLIDDHHVIGVAVGTALSPIRRMTLVATVATVDEALALPEQFDAVILDLRLRDGSSPTQNISRLNASGIGVVVYTSGEDAFLLREVATSAATALVRKSEPMSALVEALGSLQRGEPSLSLELAAAVDSDPNIPDAQLSDRENEILSLFAIGHKAQAVAFHAGISVATVGDYVRRIRAKYAIAGRPANTAVSLFQRAVEDGAVPHPASQSTLEQPR